MYKCIHINKNKYTYIICTYTYIQYAHLNADPYLNIPILKKHMRYNMWTEKYVDSYLYDQLEIVSSQFELRYYLAVYFLIY